MVKIDFETKSEVDVKKVGAWVYSIHPSTDVNCMGFKIDDKKVKLWRLGDPWPSDLDYHVGQLGPFEAHNSFFEYCMWINVMVKKHGWPWLPIEAFVCSAAKAAHFGVPSKLEIAAEVLNLENQKDMEGHAVMLRLCKPRKPSKNNPDQYFTRKKFPEKYKIQDKYCKQDVRTEDELSDYLPELSKRELKYWRLDQEINLRGIPIDVELVDAALKIVNRLEKSANKRLRELTKGEIQTTNQTEKIVNWVIERGVPMENCQAETVETLLEGDIPSSVRTVLELRQIGSKASVKKLQRIKDYIDPNDDRVRNTLRYYGAERTGRWAGQAVQTHNFKRGLSSDKQIEIAVRNIKKGKTSMLDFLFDSAMEAISSSLRPCICAPKGKVFLCSDFAGIEARGVVWVSDCTWALNNFKKGIDPYKYLASIIYNKPIEDITSKERFVGKQAVLGLGYGMGWKKFIKQCAKYGQEIPKELAQKTVKIYRENYWAVKQFWDQCETFAKQAVINKETRFTILPNQDTPIIWQWDEEYETLNCVLPSGRKLRYHEPRVEMKKTPWGKDKPTLTYMGIDSQTKKWKREKTFGGKLCENIVQAICRDLMAYSMYRVNKKYPVILTVHDEVVSEVDEHKANLEDYNNMMRKAPKWATGFPIDAEGWQGKRYKKAA